MGAGCGSFLNKFDGKHCAGAQFFGNEFSMQVHQLFALLGLDLGIGVDFLYVVVLL
jgi:hypothetical protein